jgi:hypothetical protein
VSLPVPLVQRSLRDPQYLRLPDEFALRELLDLDADLVADFAERTGFSELPIGTTHDTLDAIRSSATDDPRLAPVVAFLAEWCTDDPLDYPYEVVGLAQLQAVVQHYILWHDDGNLADAWPCIRHAEGRWYVPALDAADPSVEECWTLFEQALNRHLVLNVGFTRGESAVAPLSTAVAFQIRELVREGAPLLTCANETCGRRFVRARGGARHEQHRTKGVKYCSPSCAQAQAQREYRRRKAAEQQAQASTRRRRR